MEEKIFFYIETSFFIRCNFFSNWKNQYFYINNAFLFTLKHQNISYWSSFYRIKRWLLDEINLKKYKKQTIYYSNQDSFSIFAIKKTFLALQNTIFWSKRDFIYLHIEVYFVVFNIFYMQYIYFRNLLHLNFFEITLLTNLI